MQEHHSTIIVGGGISGICVAQRLIAKAPDADVRLLEASNYVGGHIRTERIDGYLCDVGPNGFLDREPLMLDWVEDLGLSAELVQANEAAAHRFLLLDEDLVELKPPPAFLFSPVLSLRGRARLFREPLVKPRRNSVPESIWDFAARRIGPEAADTLVSAMVLGVYGGDAKKLSLEHCFPRMAAMEREHGSLFKAMRASRRSDATTGSPMGPAGTLTTFKGGIGTLVERATKVLGDSIYTNARVESIRVEGSGYRVLLEDGTSLESARVIVATPAFAAAEFMKDLDSSLSDALASVEYAPLAVVCTGYDRDDIEHDLKGFGYLVPPNQGRDILGCTWTSSVFPHSAPGGKVLLRTMIGGAVESEAVSESDNALLDRIRLDVHVILGVRSAPQMLRIYRHERGIPQYGLDHGKVLAEIDAAQARHPGLYLTGNAYRGISMNDCVAEAYRLAERIASP